MLARGPPVKPCASTDVARRRGRRVHGSAELWLEAEGGRERAGCEIKGKKGRRVLTGRKKGVIERENPSD